MTRKGFIFWTNQPPYWTGVRQIASQDKQSAILALPSPDSNAILTEIRIANNNWPDFVSIIVFCGFLRRGKVQN